MNLYTGSMILNMADEEIKSDEELDQELGEDDTHSPSPDELGN